jgi:hypothetical protein
VRSLGSTATSSAVPIWAPVVAVASVAVVSAVAVVSLAVVSVAIASVVLAPVVVDSVAAAFLGADFLAGATAVASFVGASFGGAAVGGAAFVGRVRLAAAFVATPAVGASAVPAGTADGGARRDAVRSVAFRGLASASRSALRVTALRGFFGEPVAFAAGSTGVVGSSGVALGSVPPRRVVRRVAFGGVAGELVSPSGRGRADAIGRLRADVPVAGTAFTGWSDSGDEPASGGDGTALARVGRARPGSLTTGGACSRSVGAGGVAKTLFDGFRRGAGGSASRFFSGVAAAWNAAGGAARRRALAGPDVCSVSRGRWLSVPPDPG